MAAVMEEGWCMGVQHSAGGGKGDVPIWPTPRAAERRPHADDPVADLAGTGGGAVCKYARQAVVDQLETSKI